MADAPREIGCKPHGLIHCTKCREAAYVKSLETRVAELESQLATPSPPVAAPPASSDCPRCQGSGEDPEGFYDQSRGPDGDTHDGPCRECGGSGGAGEAVEPVATIYTMEALVPGGSVKHHATVHKAVPAGTKLYAAPPAQQLQQAVARAVEECAVICERAVGSIWEYHEDNHKRTGRNVCTNLAAAIRAKGTQ